MVEELAEEREHQVEGRREPEVRRDVRDEKRSGIWISCLRPLAHEAARAAGVGGRRGGRRVVRRLVDDQVADGPRLGVEDVSRLLRVGRPLLRRPEVWRGQAREDQVRGAKQVLIGRGDEVVERPVDGPQAERELRIRRAEEVDLVWSRPEERSTGRMVLGDFDRMKDEPQVAGVEHEPRSDGCGLRVHRRPERGSDAGETHRENHDQRQSLLRTQFSQREHSILLAGSNCN